MEILVVGHYCHDTVIQDTEAFEALGGGSAYVSRILEAKGIQHDVIANVGTDFLYAHEITKLPYVSKTFRTTHFIDRNSNGKRKSVLKNICEPIHSSNLSARHPGRAKIGIICGVAMEILPETLITLREKVDILICDAQALIRTIGENGAVEHCSIKDTPFFELLPLIDVLKASEEELAYFSVLDWKSTCVLATNGDRGSRVIQNKVETHVKAVPSEREVDATGAGDSFLAGFAIGILSGLNYVDAAHVGSKYGSYAVQFRGVPDFSLF